MPRCARMLRGVGEPRAANWRLFAAVFPSAEASAELARQLSPHWAAPSRAGLRWISGENLHVTLKFFGSVPEAGVPALSEACALAAHSGQPFELRWSGAGAFPSLRRARILWLGVAQGTRELTQLSAAVDGAVGALTSLPAASTRDHPFTPHLSVARLSAARDVARLAAALQTLDVRMQVRRLSLVRSRPGSAHARYEVIQDFELGGSATPA
jgi:RNA 2',3'-cyclic 3'-phosphodiesterase